MSTKKRRLDIPKRHHRTFAPLNNGCGVGYNKISKHACGGKPMDKGSLGDFYAFKSTSGGSGGGGSSKGSGSGCLGMSIIETVAVVLLALYVFSQCSQ